VCISRDFWRGENPWNVSGDKVLETDTEYQKGCPRSKIKDRIIFYGLKVVE
jgi:hypothetical protein